MARDGGDVAMPLDEAFEFYGTSRGAVPNYVNGFAVQSLAYTTQFDAQEAAARIRVPFLLVHSEHALVPPLARAFYASVAGPKSELPDLLTVGAGPRVEWIGFDPEAVDLDRADGGLLE